MGLFRAGNKGIRLHTYHNSHSQQTKIREKMQFGEAAHFASNAKITVFSKQFFSNRILIILPLRGAFFVALFSILAYCSYTIFAFKLKYPFIYLFFHSKGLWRYNFRRICPIQQKRRVSRSH